MPVAGVSTLYSYVILGLRFFIAAQPDDAHLRSFGDLPKEVEFQAKNKAIDRFSPNIPQRKQRVEDSRFLLSLLSPASENVEISQLASPHYAPPRPSGYYRIRSCITAEIHYSSD